MASQWIFEDRLDDNAPRAARAYARIAPGADHARHMTSHIFLALGMWDETVGANLAALGRKDDAKEAFITYLAYMPNAAIASPPFPKPTFQYSYNLSMVSRTAWGWRPS